MEKLRYRFHPLKGNLALRTKPMNIFFSICEKENSKLFVDVCYFKIDVFHVWTGPSDLIHALHMLESPTFCLTTSALIGA